MGALFKLFGGVVGFIFILGLIVLVLLIKLLT